MPKSIALRLSLLAVLPAYAQPPAWVGVEKPDRVTNGLVALYLLKEGSGAIAKDTAGKVKSLDLNFSDASGVKWLPEGGVQVAGSGSALWTAGPATPLTKALQATSQFTVEAIVVNASLAQTGPARIVSLSKDPSERNFTLGQEHDHYVVRLRTSATDVQGTPETGTGTKTALPVRQHVAVTFGAGALSLYINGQLHVSEARAGDLSNWDPSLRLVVGNEATLDRQWNGKVELVAVYSRALSAAEVKQNVEALGDESLMQVLEE